VIVCTDLANTDFCGSVPNKLLEDDLPEDEEPPKRKSPRKNPSPRNTDFCGSVPNKLLEDDHDQSEDEEPPKKKTPRKNPSPRKMVIPPSNTSPIFAIRADMASPPASNKSKSFVSIKLL